MKIDSKDISRFYTRVSFGFGDNACWTWLGGINLKTGRGMFWVNGNNISASVVSYVIHYGDILRGLFVCHHCDNPNCINPIHLFLGTNSDNQKDLYSKGLRSLKGENAPNSKITNEKAKEIRKLYETKNYTQKELGDKFGVHSTTIHCIVAKKSFMEII